MALKIPRGYLLRYRDSTRLTHWTVAILFFLAGLSGLAFFDPAMNWFTNFFGGGPWTRILHPYFGLVMAFLFLLMAARLWPENLLNRSDIVWLEKSPAMFAGHKENMPPVGKYNAGQKVVFWLMLFSLTTLTATGILFWQPWFPHFPIFWRRLGVLTHSISAVVLIFTVFIHIYAAIWVKGTMRAMTRGTVSLRWAELNHPLWARQAEAAQDPDNKAPR